jgi:hypothetical protein
MSYRIATDSGAAAPAKSLALTFDIGVQSFRNTE